MPLLVIRPSYQFFVGVDIAYRDFTVASLAPGAKPKREPKPFEQTTSGFKHFQDLLRETNLEPASILVVMEATGSYWMALAVSLHHAGFAVSVINPAQAHYFAKAQLKRAKNDALDAQTLAELALALVPACWTPPPQMYHELHQRLAQRVNLQELRTHVNNQLHALSVSPVIVPEVRLRLIQLIATLEQQIAQIDDEISQMVQITEEENGQQEISIESRWKRSIALLLTIPGVGIMTACWLVVATLNFTLCETPEAAVHYVGLAPIERKSGTSVRGRAQIGHGGHTRARTVLYLATLTAARYNPVIKTCFDRLRTADKPTKVARCACARKLLLIAFALVKNGQTFDPEYGGEAKRNALPSFS